MKANYPWMRSTLLALAVGVLLVGCSSNGPKATPQSIVEKIETARTPTDHAELAAYYDAEAAKARASAASHREMAKTYGTQNLGGGKGPAMGGHCADLARNFDAAADNFAALAKLHRELENSK